MIIDTHVRVWEIDPQPNEDSANFNPIVDLARFDNICFKLSDVAGRSEQPFPHADLHPFIQRLVNAFGASRTICGTGYPGHHRAKHNWPTLAEELRLIREGLPFLTAQDQEQILGGTAAALWRLI